MRKRIVVIGLGDAGLLTAIRLPTTYEVIGISYKPCFVSGQELGNRLAQLDDWKRWNKRNFDRFRKLDHVRIIHGLVESVNLQEQTVAIQTIDQEHLREHYDALLIATGTTNGFWRNAKLESCQQVENNLLLQAEKFRTAKTIAVVGGGPSAVSAASNLKIAYPNSIVYLFYSRSKVLSGYAERARNNVQELLADQGVVLCGNHRAKMDGVELDEIGSGEIHWQNPKGKEAFPADAILWAVGAIQPNNECLPKELLDEDGFVRVTPQLHHPELQNVFAIGDICSSDPNRSTARNDGFTIAAKNMDLYLRGEPHHKLRSFRAPTHRWGSILGIQPKGMRVYTPSGRAFVVKKWFLENVLHPMVVKKIIYGGIRKAANER